MKARTRLRPTKSWLLGTMLGVAVVMTLAGTELSARVREFAGFVVTPFGDVGIYAVSALNRRIGTGGRRSVSPTEAARLVQDNERLARRLSMVEAELSRQIQIQLEADSLYGRIPYGQWRLMPARIVAAEALPYGKTRMINKGNRDGVVAEARVTTRRLLTDRAKALPTGLPALSGNLTDVADGVMVGRIVHAGAHTAMLQLVTDAGFSIRARIRRVIDPENPRTITQTAGDAREARLTDQNNSPIDVIAVGDGAGSLLIGDVYAYDNVRVGDRLVVAQDGLLPGEVSIGTVVDVADDPERLGLFVNLKAKPAADLSALRDVFIVLPAGMPGHQDQEEP